MHFVKQPSVQLLHIKIPRSIMHTLQHLFVQPMVSLRNHAAQSRTIVAVAILLLIPFGCSAPLAGVV